MALASDLPVAAVDHVPCTECRRAHSCPCWLLRRVVRSLLRDCRNGGYCLPHDHSNFVACRLLQSKLWRENIRALIGMRSLVIDQLVIISKTNGNHSKEVNYYLID